MHKFIDYDSLPKHSSGKNIGKIDWVKSIGMETSFEYKDIKGYIKIVDYIQSKHRLIIEYNNNQIDLYTGNFIQCQFGKLLKQITLDFKCDIGDIFKDDNRDITITSREYRKTKNGSNRKWYKYTCNKCNYSDGWVEESDLLNQKSGCLCCDNKVVVKGINDIATTDPWMVKYLVNKEDAYNYTSKSNKRIYVKCPICGNTKSSRLDNLYYKGFSCSKCSDGISYPNKFMYNLLSQLNVDFLCEYSPEWVDGKRYDFYIPSMNLIIEMDGAFHYIDNDMSGVTKEQSKCIDEYKDEAAKNNNLKIIRIDCDYKDVCYRYEYIKSNIISSDLNNIFNLSNINWSIIDELSLNSKIKICCEFYNENKNKLMLKCMAKEMKVSISTLIQYLKKGNELNWCDYKPRKEI